MTNSETYNRPPVWHSWVSAGNLLIGSVLALIAAVFSLGVACARAADRVDAMDTRVSNTERRVSSIDLNQSQRLSELDRRMERLQEQITITQNDVAWIRRELEKVK